MLTAVKRKVSIKVILTKSRNPTRQPHVNEGLFNLHLVSH